MRLRRGSFFAALELKKPPSEWDLSTARHSSREKLFLEVAGLLGVLKLTTGKVPVCAVIILVRLLNLGSRLPTAEAATQSPLRQQSYAPEKSIIFFSGLGEVELVQSSQQLTALISSGCF